MGNNQGGLHKRERTDSQRNRVWSSNTSNTMGTANAAEDGCPVQVIFFQIFFIIF